MTGERGEDRQIDRSKSAHANDLPAVGSAATEAAEAAAHVGATKAATEATETAASVGATAEAGAAEIT